MEKVRVKPNLMIYKRLPVKNQNENIQTILELNRNNKEFQFEFLSNNNIEKKLEICKDDSIGNFIKCSFNKLGDSYRSPWTNKYFPEPAHPVYPPEIFREFEKSFNDIYALYAKLYYGNQAVSSVYIWEQGDSLENGFNIALLIDNEKELANDKSDGVVNSVNIVNARFIKEKEKADLVKIEEGAYVKSLLDINGHVEKIGKLIEYIENNIRASLDEVQLRKAKEIVDNTRKTENHLNIPIDYLKTKDELLNNIQEYWITKSNSETGSSNNLAMHSRTSSNIAGLENITKHS